jgi:hypothetical protein
MLKKVYVLDSSSPTGPDDPDLTLVAFAALLSDVLIMNTVRELHLFMLQVLSQAAQIAQSIWRGVQPDRCQFHQHFLSSFCAKILLPKITNPNCKHLKAAQKTFV